MNLDRVKDIIPEGMLFINKSDVGGSDINVQFTEAENLGDVIVEFKEFLLGCGFAKTSIDEYIETE